MLRIIIFVIAISFLAESIPLKKVQLGHCGKMAVTFEPSELPDEIKLYNSEEDKEEDYDDARIVGGYEAPEPIPWFALLKINTQNGAFDGSRCGATLISTKY
jgi:hypothetical protein